jgi:hypothetical protein
MHGKSRSRPNSLPAFQSLSIKRKAYQSPEFFALIRANAAQSLSP